MVRRARPGKLTTNGELTVRPERSKQAEVSQGVQKKQRASKPPFALSLSKGERLHYD